MNAYDGVQLSIPTIQEVVNGEFVKKTREKLELDKKDFADLIGVSHTELSMWESFNQCPPAPVQHLIFLLRTDFRNIKYFDRGDE